MLLIIDMNNLAHRHFHTASGELTTKDGTPSGVILGCLNSIKGYIEKFMDVDKVIACFDNGKSEWRKSLYPDYKGQRDYGKDDPEKAEKYNGLWNQIDILADFLPTLGVNVLRVEHQEADDLIAATCEYFPNETKLIITSDKDMLQLIDSNTTVYSPYKDRVISLLNFYEETKVTKDAYIGYRALLGDSSDNIQGIPGIGEKTAKNLMDKYGNIDNVLGAVGDNKKALMKSARTKRIFEPANLQILGRNNKLMSFKYAQYDILEEPVTTGVSQQLITDSKAVREFLMHWQFVSVLSNYMPWILTFKSLNHTN